MKKRICLLSIAAFGFLVSCSDNSEDVFQDIKPIKVNVKKIVGGSPIDFEKTF